MPTFETEESFLRDYRQLTREQREAFRQARARFIEDLKRDGVFRASLRVKPMQDYHGIWEMTWNGNDGRAVFSYGPEVIPGEAHIIWRRVGKHIIFKNA